MTEEEKKALTSIAARLLSCQNMPPIYEIDWNFPKSTPKKTRRMVIEQAERTTKKCRELANEIMAVVMKNKKKLHILRHFGCIQV